MTSVQSMGNPMCCSRDCLVHKQRLHCMQGMSEYALIMVSSAISYALRCAGRCTGSRTTSIRICTQAVANTMYNSMRPGGLTGDSNLPNVVCLELVLEHIQMAMYDDYASASSFAHSLLQRVPNLFSARLWYHKSPYASYVPLLQLKHLDLGCVSLDELGCMPFAALFPVLETANLNAEDSGEDSNAIPELDVSGCRLLKRLVLTNVTVCRLSKPPQCNVRVDMLAWSFHAADEISQLEPGLLETNEVLLCSRELFQGHGLLSESCLPKLEVIRCDWDTVSDHEADNADELAHCLRHSRNLPALKSIFCGDSDKPKDAVMPVCIPAGLVSLPELIFATDRPLQLFFDSACDAGERLNTLFLVASEVRVDAADLLDMTDALFRRGLTLSMARAGEEHEGAPSQCMYVRALSAPQLSYDEAIGFVNARVERWGKHHDDCAQCGACFNCLRKAGVLESS